MSLQQAQRLLLEWGERCFGRAHMYDLRARSLRHVEEAIELAQACDAEKEKVHKLVDIIYAKPRGDLHQEVGGGVIVTLLMLGVNVEACLWDETARILDLPTEKFTKRNEEKNALGID